MNQEEVLNLEFDNSNIENKKYAWWGCGSFGSAPKESDNIKFLLHKGFLSDDDTGTFNIFIPIGTQEVYFFIPKGKNVSVTYIQSAGVDVTSTFKIDPIFIEGIKGEILSYESWIGKIGLSGYPDIATYKVIIK